jgi:hypothetical protein
MTPVEGPLRRYHHAMRIWLALLVIAAVAAPASCAGFDEALRASGLTPLTKAARLQPQSRTPDWDGSLSGALWLREEAFADSERSECGGAPGCGRQVSDRWLAQQQTAAASRALEETLLRRYGLRGWSRGMMARRSDDAAHMGAAAVVGAVLLYADGLHLRAAVSGVRLAMDVAPGRRINNDRDLARLEVGPQGKPLSMTAAFGRHAPSLGLGYRLRY